MEHDAIFLRDKKTGAMVNIADLSLDEYERLLEHFRQLSAAYYTLKSIRASKKKLDKTL